MITMVCDFCGKNLDDEPSVEGHLAGVEVDLCSDCSRPIVKEWERKKVVVAECTSNRFDD